MQPEVEVPLALKIKSNGTTIDMIGKLSISCLKGSWCFGARLLVGKASTVINSLERMPFAEQGCLWRQVSVWQMGHFVYWKNSINLRFPCCCRMGEHSKQRVLLISIVVMACQSAGLPSRLEQMLEERIMGLKKVSGVLVMANKSPGAAYAILTFDEHRDVYTW